MPVRNKWIWGISGTRKYAVKDFVEIFTDRNTVTGDIQVVARKRVGWELVLLKEYPTKLEAKQFINETFPTR